MGWLHTPTRFYCQKTIFRHFPIKIPIKTSHGWQRGIYGSINLKKFMKPSFAQPKNISEDQTSNPNFFFLNQANVYAYAYATMTWESTLRYLNTLAKSDLYGELSFPSVNYFCAGIRDSCWRRSKPLNWLSYSWCSWSWLVLRTGHTLSTLPC